MEIAGELWNAVNAHGHRGVELEFRLGHMLGHFSPNVGKDPFFKLKKKLDASEKFSRVIDIETVEKIADVKHVTTLAIVDSQQHNPPPPSFCMTKRKVFQTELPGGDGPYTIRVGIALEKIVPLRTVHSKLTRHKKRRRYIHKCWAFDLTEVVSNGDLDNEESYEVELELLDTGVLFENTMDYVVQWGLELLDDLLDMLRECSS